MPNGRRARDYRAEEAARNRKARELGFTSRAQMRRALRQGWTPRRKSEKPRSPIVAPHIGEVERPAPTGVTGFRRIKAEAAQWSRRHSRQETSRFDPEWPRERVIAYHNAYVNPETRANRLDNDLASLRLFLVDDMGFYTDDVFDDRYQVSWSRQMFERYGGLRGIVQHNTASE